MEKKRVLNELLKKIMGGIPSHHLSQPQFFHVSSRTIVLANIPHGTGPEELLWELLSRVRPMGDIQKLHMFGPRKCTVRFELPTQAKRAVLQITRMISYDLQLYHLGEIFTCLESEAKEKIRDLNLRIHQQTVAESSRTLFVRNFGQNTTRYMLQNTFSAFGELHKIPDIFLRPNGDRFTFVTYLHQGDRDNALIRAQGLQLPDGTHLWITNHNTAHMNEVKSCIM